MNAVAIILVFCCMMLLILLPTVQTLSKDPDNIYTSCSLEQAYLFDKKCLSALDIEYFLGLYGL